MFLATVGAEYLSGRYDGSVNWGPGATYFYLLLNVTLVTTLITKAFIDLNAGKKIKEILLGMHIVN